MTKQQFADGIVELRLVFDLPKVRPEVLATWFRFLFEIQDDEWRRIVDRISRAEERFPQNFVRCVESYRERRINDASWKLPPPTDMTEAEIEENKRLFREMMASIGGHER